MPGNKQSGMKEEPAENTKKRGNMKMKTELQKQLFALQDPGYREFHARLIPGIPKEDIIGIRTPAEVRRGVCQRSQSGSRGVFKRTATSLL